MLHPRASFTDGARSAVAGAVRRERHQVADRLDELGATLEFFEGIGELIVVGGEQICGRRVLTGQHRTETEGRQGSSAAVASRICMWVRGSSSDPQPPGQVHLTN